MASNTSTTTTDSYENQFFYEDEVLKFDKNGRVKFGLVLETYEAGLSDESDMEDNIRKGEIRVAWHPEGVEEVIDEKYIGLADRTLMPGDVVRRSTRTKDIQKGYCREVLVSADVRIKGTTYIVKNVTSDRLRPLLTMLRDNAVCLDSWVGSTTSICEKLVLKSSCGSILELRPDQEYCPLKDPDTKYRHEFFSGSLFYPGQTLVGPVNALQNAKWITSTPEIRNSRRCTTFIVQSVEIEGVYVHWQCKALSDGSESTKEDQPNGYVTGDDLSRLRSLNLFESCMLQINDKNYVTIEERDIVNLTNKSQWRRERSTCFENYKILHNNKNAKQKLSTTNAAAAAATATATATAPTQIHCEVISKTDTGTTEKKTNFCSRIKFGTSNFKHSNNSTTTTATATFENIDQDCRKQVETALSKMLRIERRMDQYKSPDSEGWKTDDESNSCSDSLLTGSSCCSSPTPKSSPKRSPLLVKRMKKFKKRNNKKFQYNPPKIGDKVVTETVVVYSNATVVWQDGTIETGIASRQLYPIHHLDEHEFFPGDFVLASTETTDLSYRDYGVIQNVDHLGRTALVKWFRTYTCTDVPRPEFVNESEASVYDLKDHPDFQYRPGTIVIRVANFIGEDSTCTAGQVVDNYPEGRVKVWWVDGHSSMCWPQDLFEVGQNDGDHNFWLGNESDNDSWETQSEISEPGSPIDPMLKPKFATNLERCKKAMNLLGDMFASNPRLESPEVMRRLLDVYKKCRFTDRLMNTTFFHEDNFMGLIERVRRNSTVTTADRVQDHKNRLFNESPKSAKILSSSSVQSSRDNNVFFPSTPSQNQHNLKRCGPLNSTRAKRTNLTPQYYPDINVDDVDCDGGGVGSDSAVLSNNSSDSLFGCIMTTIVDQNAKQQSIDNCEELSANIVDITAAAVAAATLPSTNDRKLSSPSANNDSGNHTKTNSEWGEASGYTSSDITTDINSTSLLKPNQNDGDQTTSNSCCSIEMIPNEELSEFACARLCALIKVQLLKALQEINHRLLTNIQSADSLGSECLGTVKTDKSDGLLTEVEADPAAAETILNDDEYNTNKSFVEDESEVMMSSTIISEEDALSSSLPTAVPSDCFLLMEKAPTTHQFGLSIFEPTNAQQYFKAVRFDHKLLKTALPPGVWVRAFEDRIDLLSVMIEGPKKTPYEDGMFLFDIQLGKEYPRTPPSCLYISYCSDRLNPNLYENGKVCISLLGTWAGRGSEVWGPGSTLLQVIVSIQGLILVAEPYFNEAGYEKQKGTLQGIENSRMYNEMVILKLIQSMIKMISNPPEIFAEQILQHFRECGDSMYNRIKIWMDLSNNYNMNNKSPTNGDKTLVDFDVKNNGSPTIVDNEEKLKQVIPEFSLVPASRGFCLTLIGLLEKFRNTIQQLQAHQQLPMVKCQTEDSAK